MPPKARITKEDIVKAALALIREGDGAMPTARGIAAALACSTQPIFSNFSSMEELEEEVTRLAYETYLGFLDLEASGGRYPKYKAFGMAYIRFAKEEKGLFKLLFMCDREGKPLVRTPDFETSVAIIMQANGVDYQTAELMHLECWACVHGIATMLATSFLDLEGELISRMVSDVYQGIQKKHKEANG